MKYHFKPFFTAVILLLLIFPAFGQSIKADYDGKYDFNKYKTYAWLAPGDSVLNRYRSDKVFGGFITWAANQELMARGLKIDTLAPQAIFVFDTMVKDSKQYSQGPTLSLGVGVAGPGYYVGGSAPVAGGKITESTVTSGAYVIAMYDAASKRQIWRCYAERTLKMSDDIQAIIADYTKKMFKKLPVKKKS